MFCVVVFSGKILSDGSTISEYKIQENSFVVIMVTKTKNPPPKQAAATAVSRHGGDWCMLAP